MQDWMTKSASDQGRAIAKGQLDPVELADAYLDAITHHPQAKRIYARTTDLRAFAEARAARSRAQSGHRLGLLDGVPLSWKDLFDSHGVATEAGSDLLAGRVPDRDARVMRVASAQGAVCLGKTHMSELAFSGLGVNPVKETSPCVNDLAAVSGGSSSGAATSVAFGLAAAAIGSDTGGSVRIPAAWNDLVGLKTTSGLLSLEGVVPLCLRFDTIGPLTRSVEDAAQILALLQGQAAPDLTGARAEGLRFGVLKTLAQDDLRPEPAAAFEAVLGKLGAAGVQFEEFEAPEVTEAMGYAGILYTAEAYGLWSEVIEAAPDKMFPEILTRFRQGANFAAKDYVAAWARLDQLRATYLARTAGYDAVILPTAPSLPPNLERLLSDHDYFVAENLLALRNTRIGNLMGLAALTLPAGAPSCGVMLQTAPFSEARLLRMGAAVEQVLA
ncbi:MAG: amidase [Mangrovicoccus sp.]